MKRAIAGLLVCFIVAVALVVGMRRGDSSAVKVCRADAQGFAEENDSYEAEYDTMYGATTLAQRPMSELFDRDKELASCLRTDPGNHERYRALLDRDGFIESVRFLAYLNDTKQAEDFAQWERGQQATQLAAQSAKYDAEK